MKRWQWLFVCFLLTYLSQAYGLNKNSCTAADKNAIEVAIKNYMNKTQVMDYSAVTIASKQCSNGYAKATSHPIKPTTDDATIYLKKVNGSWQVLDYGTDFAPDFLAKIPKELR